MHADLRNKYSRHEGRQNQTQVLVLRECEDSATEDLERYDIRWRPF